MEFKDFSRTPPKIQGLFKTVRTPSHKGNTVTAYCFPLSTLCDLLAWGGGGGGGGRGKGCRVTVGGGSFALKVVFGYFDVADQTAKGLQTYIARVKHSV